MNLCRYDYAEVKENFHLIMFITRDKSYRQA